MQTAISLTYRDVESLLLTIVYKFRQRYGGDPSELQSIANEYFVRAYRSYNPDRARFSTHVWSQVWFGLRNSTTKDNQQLNRMNPTPDLEPTAKTNNWLADFLEGMSEDAVTIIESLTDAPKDLRLTLCRYHNRDCPRNIRNGLIEYLEDLGWNQDRIRSAFRQIKEAL